MHVTYRGTIGILSRKTAMDKTFSRIRQITEELYLVRDELNKRAANDSIALSSALIERDGADALIAFKAAVDEIRQFLWHYLTEFVSSSEKAVGDRMREYQIRRAAQLLLALSSAYPHEAKLYRLEAAAQDVIRAAESTDGKPAAAHD